MNHDTADSAKTSSFRFVVGGLVAGIPGGFVIDQDMDAVFTGDFTDGQGVVERDGQRFFNHDGDPVLRGDFDSGSVPGDGGVDQDGLGMGLFDHIGFLAIEEGRGKRVFLLILREKGGVVVGDADQFHVGVVGQVSKKAFNVAMDQSDDGYAEGSGTGLGKKRTR